MKWSLRSKPPLLQQLSFPIFLWNSNAMHSHYDWNSNMQIFDFKCAVHPFVLNYPVHSSIIWFSVLKLVRKSQKNVCYLHFLRAGSDRMDTIRSYKQISLQCIHMTAAGMVLFGPASSCQTCHTRRQVCFINSSSGTQGCTFLYYS